MSGSYKRVNTIRFRKALLALCICACAGLGLVWASQPESSGTSAPRRFTPAISDSLVDSFVLIRSEPISEDYFPCSDCHEPGDDVDIIPRVLEEEHDDKTLTHGESTIWCLDCHDREERDHLHGASGNPIPFEDSHKLCGQCHGRMYQEWKRGVHGKRVGSWNGEKQYYSCLMCHNPHAPHFKPLTPLPVPLPPDSIR